MAVDVSGAAADVPPGSPTPSQQYLRTHRPSQSYKHCRWPKNVFIATKAGEHCSFSTTFRASASSSRWTTKGPAYSSLGSLRRFPVDSVKIERSSSPNLRHDPARHRDCVRRRRFAHARSRDDHFHSEGVRDRPERHDALDSARLRLLPRLLLHAAHAGLKRPTADRDHRDHGLRPDRGQKKASSFAQVPRPPRPASDSQEESRRTLRTRIAQFAASVTAWTRVSVAIACASQFRPRSKSGSVSVATSPSPSSRTTGCPGTGAGPVRPDH